MNWGILFLIVFMGISLVGCDFYSNMGKKLPFTKPVSSEVKEQAAPDVDEFELAKLILKREKKPITIKKDPFEPLIRLKEAPGTGAIQGQPLEPKEEVLVEAIDFVGMGGMGEKVGALLRSPTGRGLFFVNDTFQGLTIISITETEVTVKKDAQTYKIKRRVN